jgi:hypothetical protein
MPTFRAHMRTVQRFLPPVLLAICLAATGARAETDFSRWRIEQGADEPSYAAVAPTTTNLNIDMVVLACEEVRGGRALELQVYLTDDGPLRAKVATSWAPKDDPRAEISIDGHTLPVSLLFADEYAVLADAQEARLPRLSDWLVGAMKTGKTMTLRFDLLAERPGEPPAFDGEAVVDLQAPGGHQAIAAMSRCVHPGGELRVGASELLN